MSTQHPSRPQHPLTSRPLNSRVYQANLPVVSKPGLSLSADGDTNAKLQTRQEKQWLQYDKTSKQLSILHPEDPVRVLNPLSHKWEPGIVKCHADTPRSYVVTMADDSTRRCNRSHIRPTGENITLHDGSDMETVEPKSDAEENSVPTSPATCPQTTAGSVDREFTLRRSSRVIKPPEKLNL